MKLPQGVEPLSEPLKSLYNLLVRFNQRGVVIGGIAASLLGRPRYTEDLDAMFLLSSTDEIRSFLDASANEGFEPRIKDVLDFAKKNRVVLLRHIESDTPIDISLGILPFEEEMVERSKLHHFDGLIVRLPTPEDLIIMKAVAHRPKDLEDIRNIVVKHPDIDIDRIEYWVKAFAELLELPDLWGQISKILEG